MTNTNFNEIIELLKARFETNMNRHIGISWAEVKKRLLNNPQKLMILMKMEKTGGEPDVVVKEQDGSFVFYDCSEESPAGRRNLCYDRQALEARKKFKPENSVMDMVIDMGVELMTEEQYRMLQLLGSFDTKTSSWLATPIEVRELGGAIFADRRYNKVFIYHNGADSYYGSRGFRGVLTI